MLEMARITAIRRLWKYRLLRCVQDAAIVLLGVFIVIWLFSPVFFAGYFREAMPIASTPFSLLSVLSLPMLVLNFSLVEDNIVAGLIKSIVNKRKALNTLITSAKELSRIIKKWAKYELKPEEHVAMRAHLKTLGIKAMYVD